MLARLAAIDGLHCVPNAPLSQYTRFGIGGPACVLADAATENALIEAVHALEGRYALIGGGTNLVAADEGFPGAVLRYTANALEVDGTAIRAAAGVVLQDLVDAAMQAGLAGLHTMTGIPGWVGGAIYGNAGAYGHSIEEFVESVRFFDGRRIREIGRDACQFRYRESVFKQHKDWIILEATLRLPPGDPAALRAAAAEIRKIRDQKYPPAMRCAGSIFKNLLLAELPEAVRARIPAHVVREGKAPAAYFLELAGAKGLACGGIRVADYHANLIYNESGGTASQVREVIDILKDRVKHQFGLGLEEEVQYVPGRN
jgi:UDP-N-acetylmuramate dehydrogenase